MANDHMATPAVPPAKIMAPRLRSAGEEPTGVKYFFVTSYAAKYLEHRSVLFDSRFIHQQHTTLTRHCLDRHGLAWLLFHERCYVFHPPCTNVALHLTRPCISDLYLPDLESNSVYDRRGRMDINSKLTCSKTFALSTGAVTSVVGTADKKPAVASSAIDRV
jgi:hypothetical protein